MTFHALFKQPMEPALHLWGVKKDPKWGKLRPDLNNKMGPGAQSS